MRVKEGMKDWLKGRSKMEQEEVKLWSRKGYGINSFVCFFFVARLVMIKMQRFFVSFQRQGK